MDADIELEILEFQIRYIDPQLLPQPWCSIVWYWVHNLPDRLFLPDLDDPTRFWLDWDDLRAIYIHAGVLSSGLPPH